MEEGTNQGCPLSSTLAALVFHTVIGHCPPSQPYSMNMQQQDWLTVTLEMMVCVVSQIPWPTLTANMCVYISTACFSSSPSLIACPSQRHEAQYLQNTNPYLHFRSICHPCHPSPVRSCPSQQHPRSHSVKPAPTAQDSNACKPVSGPTSWLQTICSRFLLQRHHPSRIPSQHPLFQHHRQSQSPPTTTAIHPMRHAQNTSPPGCRSAVLT